jgi:hypothetical protein
MTTHIPAQTTTRKKDGDDGKPIERGDLTTIRNGETHYIWMVTEIMKDKIRCLLSIPTETPLPFNIVIFDKPQHICANSNCHKLFDYYDILRTGLQGGHDSSFLRNHVLNGGGNPSRNRHKIICECGQPSLVTYGCAVGFSYSTDIS